MVKWVRVALVLAAGWVGAAFWAYGITVIEPLCEAQAHCSWARDLRWAAILGVCAALAIVAWRWSVAGLALLWLAADVGLDHVDLGRPGLLPAFVFAGGLVTAAAFRLGEPAPAPPRSSRRVRGLAAALACTLAVLAAAV